MEEAKAVAAALVKEEEEVQHIPSVSFHRCRCVSVKSVERLLSVLEARVNVREGLRGRARCVAPRASADAASAA